MVGVDILEYILRTSAVSLTNFESILIFASCVVGTCNIVPGMWVSFLNGRVIHVCFVLSPL